MWSIRLVEDKVAKAMEENNYDLIKLYAVELDIIDGTKVKRVSWLSFSVAGGYKVPAYYIHRSLRMILY